MLFIVTYFIVYPRGANPLRNITPSRMIKSSIFLDVVWVRSNQYPRRARGMKIMRIVRDVGSEMEFNTLPHPSATSTKENYPVARENRPFKRNNFQI